MTTEELLAAAGITVTEEGKARARARLDAAGARWTPEKWAALREQVGLDPRGVTARPVRIVLDTSAVIAYTQGSLDVGEVIAEVDQEDAAAALPILCLVEASRVVASSVLLDLLVNHRATIVSAPEPSDWRVLANFHRTVGRLDSSSAVLAATRRRCQILTREPGFYAGLTDGGPVIPF